MYDVGPACSLDIYELLYSPLSLCARTVFSAGVPFVGQVPSAALATKQSPPIIAFLRASNRRKVAKFKKFPSHSVSEQAVAKVAFTVAGSKRASAPAS